MHFSRLVSTYIYNFFHRKNKREIPLLYSNVPLRYKWYRVLTRELLLRQERFAYGSVAYVNEASLLADSKMYKDDDLNETLMLFCKLFGHETYGGFLCFDTQALSDCHYAVKRCLSEYIHLDGKKKVPFGMLCGYRRMKMFSSEDSLDVNVFNGKEGETPTVFIPKLVWKIFDAYCYSVLTDHLPVSDVHGDTSDLKSRQILTFNPRRFAQENMRLDCEVKQHKNKEIDINEYKKVLRLCAFR